MTNFSGTLWRSGDKLLCCWPQSPPPKLTCFALLLLGASQHWAVTHSDRGTSQMFSSSTAREVQEWASGILAPVPDSTADSCCLVCLSVPLCSMLDGDVTSWLKCVVLWEVQALLFSNQLCSWNEADASHRYPGAVRHFWGTFNLKWRHHSGHVLGEEVSGCLWWVLLTIILVLHADFGKLF